MIVFLLLGGRPGPLPGAFAGGRPGPRLFSGAFLGFSMGRAFSRGISNTQAVLRRAKTVNPEPTGLSPRRLFLCHTSRENAWYRGAVRARYGNKRR